MSKFALKAIDEVLRRKCENDDIFGGKTLLLGGNFRQLSNIVLMGTPIDIIENSLKSSSFWKYCTVLKLTINMRSRGDLSYNDWILSTGNGTANDDENLVQIPEEFLERECLVNTIYRTGQIDPFESSVSNKVILTTKNEYAILINIKVLNLLKCQSRVYKSADDIVSEDQNEQIRYPLEFLKNQQPSGMPPSKLELKIGAVVMLLKNIDQKKGLPNGTRLILLGMKNNYLIGKIISGKSKDNIVSNLELI